MSEGECLPNHERPLLLFIYLLAFIIASVSNAPGIKRWRTKTKTTALDTERPLVMDRPVEKASPLVPKWYNTGLTRSKRVPKCDQD